jgi:dihydrofolate reductase
MGKLIYIAIQSLDGYIEDAQGKFDWGEPDEEVHTFVNDLVRPVGTYLYGRRLYEVMTYWETVALEGQPHYIHDFAALWQAADKVVYSRTLEAPFTAKTQLERDFDPEGVRRMKAEAAPDLTVGGPALAAHAFQAGLVDELHLLVVPVVVGGGKPSLPGDVRLELVSERCFGNGTVFLRYRVRA